MAPNPPEKFSFEALSQEIRDYLSEAGDEDSITRALRRIQAAQRRGHTTTNPLLQASTPPVDQGVVREQAPSPAAPDEPPSTTTSLALAFNGELEQARNIQKKLLPDTVPDLPGLDVATYSRFCHDVGGDYYDFITLPGGRCGLIVADVSGKGVPAAMVMVMFRSILRMVAANDLSPAQTLGHTNQLVKSDLLRGMFITAIYAVLDPAHRTMTFVNAGHNPPLIWRPRLTGTRAINIKGPAIGLLPADKFEDAVRQKTLPLEAGDCLCLYTDGATEAQNLLGEQFGERALARAFRGAGERSAQEIVQELVDAIDGHQEEAPQHDDITLVVLRMP